MWICKMPKKRKSCKGSLRYGSVRLVFGPSFREWLLQSLLAAFCDDLRLSWWERSPKDFLIGLTSRKSRSSPDFITHSPLRKLPYKSATSNFWRFAARTKRIKIDVIFLCKMNSLAQLLRNPLRASRTCGSNPFSSFKQLWAGLKFADH